MTLRVSSSACTLAGRVAAVAFTAAALGGCHKAPPPAKPKIPVQVASVGQASVPVLITANGVIEPMQTVAVRAQVTGTLTEVDFSEGQDVTQGQVLFRIDPRPFQAVLDQAEGKLASDRAQAQSTARDAERYKALVQKDYVTQSQADQAVATAASAAATVKSDEATVESARLNLAYTTVHAPISGRTGSLLVRQGNLVDASGSQSLVVINQIHPILARFAVPQGQLASIQEYSRKGKLAVQVMPSEGAGPGGAGTLSFIDNSVDSTTGTVLLKATMPNADNALWPGEFVRIKLQLYMQQNAVTVPAQAVQTGQEGTYVFTVDQSGSTQQRSVVVNRTIDTTAVIDHGLSPGETVVTDGQSRLSPGSKVVVKKGSTS